MADSNKGAGFLDARAAQIITGDSVDFERYLNVEERNRIIPAAALAEEGKRLMLLGREAATGLPLPWDKTNGKVMIAPGKLCLWVGWSHHGKSQMLKQVMLHAMSLSEAVCMASMEEEVKELWCDMGRVACGFQEPSSRLIDEWVKFSTGKLWLYDQQGEVRAEKILAVMRYCALELGVSQFVIDSLMMLAVSRDDYDAQSKFVGRLKTLAKDAGCTVHLVAHMRKREGKTGDEQPGTMHDISGGHEIGSKADYIFNVWRDIHKKIPGNPQCVLGIDKQRGRTNWIGKLGLNFHDQSRQFIEGNYPIKFWQQEREEMPL
jgi:twinkle protein